MKQSLFLRTSELFPGSDIVRKFTFKTMGTRDSYALLARANHQVAFDFANTRDKYVHFQIIDCFECQLPQIKSA